MKTSEIEVGQEYHAYTGYGYNVRVVAVGVTWKMTTSPKERHDGIEVEQLDGPHAGKRVVVLPRYIEELLTTRRARQARDEARRQDRAG